MSDQFKAAVVRGVGWSAARTWGSRLVTFIVFPILARILGPEAYGLIALAGVFLTVLDIFSDVSFGAAIEQRQDLEPEHLDTVFWAFLVLGALLTAISMISAPLVASFFDEPELAAVIRWLSLGFLLQMVSGVQTSILRRDLRMGALAATTMAATVLGAAVGITMALLGHGVWSIVGQRLVMRLFSAMLIWRQSGWQPRRRFSWSHLRDVSGFGLSMMGSRVLSYLNRQFDQLLIGRMLGKVDLGYYFTASRLYNLLSNMLIGTVSQVAMPAMARLQDDRPRFQRAYVTACRYISLVAMPVFAGMSLLAEEFILVLTGPEWRASIPVLQVLSLVGIVHSIQYVNGAAIMALGRANLRLYTQIVHSVVNVVGFLLVVRYGFVAVAIAYTARAWLLLPLDLGLGRYLGAVSLRALGGVLWPQMVATLGMSSVIWWLRGGALANLDSFPRLLVLTAVGALVYGGLVVALSRGLVAELRDLIGAPRRDRDATRKEHKLPSALRRRVAPRLVCENCIRSGALTSSCVKHVRLRHCRAARNEHWSSLQLVWVAS
jgi:PST family polysaccharide transporter